MKIQKVFSFLLLHLALISQVDGSEVGDFLKNLDGANAVPTRAELAEALFTSLQVEAGAAAYFGEVIGCKCKNKNFTSSDPVAFADTPANRLQIANKTKTFINFFGDSMTHWVRVEPITKIIQVDVDPHIYYGTMFDNVKFDPLGGTTSGNLRKHFDKCGDNNPNIFYPEPGSNDHIQLENTYSVVLYGGNDFLTYKPIIQAIPWLTYFRINAVVNNLNRVITYHQAQGAKVLLIGHTPRPETPLFNFFGDLGSAGSFFQTMFSYAGSLLGTVISGIDSGVQDVLSCINFQMCNAHRSVDEINAAALYSESRSRAVELLFASGFNMSDSNRTDSTWISQQLGYLTLSIQNLVVLRRNVEWINEWFEFSDPGAVAMGRWWAGNPSLYRGDSIHFVHPFGHALHAKNVKSKIESLGWSSNPIPSYGDRCNAVNGATFPTGQPAGFTPEPEPLPGVSDDDLNLILLCFIFKICKF
ncbi:hypothetical protein [Leptospira licerasiae]|uniref:hypothetical protein n=1 Tax=Leptospira licerasiae TaxID=447106 RepID=UPI001082EE02|nr:hypothetical protein [Leptospira licerasiae]TGM88507.1 hypothetical protein EHR05_13595 [Leptospira licerasiae]